MEKTVYTRPNQMGKNMHAHGIRSYGHPVALDGTTS
jgi:hypothetical protein